jgi:hypothetical protein
MKKSYIHSSEVRCLKKLVVKVCFPASISDHVFCKSYVLLKILSRGIFLSVNELHAGVHKHKCPHLFVTSHSPSVTFFTKIMSLIIFQGTFSSQCSSRNCIVVSMPCCYIAFRFNRVFCENYTLVKILSRGIFILVFIKELHGGVHSHEYPYHVTSSHSTESNF